MSKEVRITPSILNANREHLLADIESISEVSDLIHLDIMDNKFVPNSTWDLDQAREIISGTRIPIDSHLMIEDVDRLALEYARAGSASVTIHVEAARDIRQTIKSIQALGARASIALKPGTPLEQYLQYFDCVDMVLIMTVEPGFGGQAFMEDMLPKISATRAAIGSRSIWLQVDGGISLSTIERAADAGADTFVAGSAVFNSENPRQMVESLRALAASM